MYYFVIGSDGQQYGPADIDMLVGWVGEGRIVASTVLIERGTDRTLAADSLPALAAALRRGSGPVAPVAIEREADPVRSIPGPAARPVQATPVYSNAPPPIPQVMPPGMMPYAQYGMPRKSKIAAGLLGIFLGSLGIHRFYLGYVGVGLAQLFLTLSTTVGCFPGAAVAGIWGFVEGILCLCGAMRDARGQELRD